jgi:hypothetical protein
MVQRTDACSRPENRRQFVGGDDMTRVFLAGIFHETHSFTGTVTGLDGFVIHRGEEILRRRGDASQVDGFLSVAEREGWEVVPSAVYTGGASGTVRSVLGRGEARLGKGAGRGVGCHAPVVARRHGHQPVR